MVECARHVNLVKVPTDAAESEAVIGRTFSECDLKQGSLLRQLMSILEGEKLSRLAMASESQQDLTNLQSASQSLLKNIGGTRTDQEKIEHRQRQPGDSGPL